MDTLVVVAVLGLDGVGREEHGRLRGTVDLIIQDRLLHLHEEHALSTHNEDYQQTVTGVMSDNMSTHNEDYQQTVTGVMSDNMSIHNEDYQQTVTGVMSDNMSTHNEDYQQTVTGVMSYSMLYIVLLLMNQ